MSIRSELEGRLKTWADANNLPVVWQNTAYQPVAGKTYLRAFLMPAASTSRDLAGVNRTHRGVFQVSVIAPAGTGSGAAEAIAESIAALYPPNLALGIVKTVGPMTVAPALQGEATYTVPVWGRYVVDLY